MILQKLFEYYNNLLQQNKVPAIGWTIANVSAKLLISNEGELQEILPTENKIKKGGKKETIKLKTKVPEQRKKPNKPYPYFLCDSAPYLLGIDPKGEKLIQSDDPREKAQGKKLIEKAQRYFESSKSYHLRLLRGCSGPVAKALLNFYDLWDPKKARINPKITSHMDILGGGNECIFQVNGKDAQEDSEIIERYRKDYFKQSDKFEKEKGQCLVTGEKDVPIVRIHPVIKGMPNGRATGTFLVSFNIESCKSYGHDNERGFNAPVSAEAAYGYATALNYLISNKHYVNIQNFTAVYWTQSAQITYQQIFKNLINLSQSISDKELQGILSRLLNGMPSDVGQIKISPNEPFYILGLALNNGRLSVCFFYENTFGQAIRHLMAHQERMKIVKPPRAKQRFISINDLLKAATKMDSQKPKLSVILSGRLLKSILSDMPYPESMFRNVMLRVFADSDDHEVKGKRINKKITYTKVAFIKAYLLKNCKESWVKDLNMALNENCKEPAYVLGRLFEVLEELQIAAAKGSINSTIKDRYFNAACTRPALIFPILLKLSHSHMRKLERDQKGIAVYLSKKIGHLSNMINVETGGDAIPKQLPLVKQGLFILGYYQEKESHYQKKEYDNNESN